MKTTIYHKDGIAKKPDMQIQRHQTELGKSKKGDRIDT